MIELQLNHRTTCGLTSDRLGTGAASAEVTKRITRLGLAENLRTEN
jgi:hypothetical protein